MRVWLIIKLTFSLLLCVVSVYSSAHVRIVLSVALTDTYFEFRKQQYLEMFKTLATYGYGPTHFYIVEALKKRGPTFLDGHCQNIFYSTANNPNFRNQGTNEARTILQGSYYFNFDPEDMVLKLTGRYHLLSDYFLRLVEENPRHDAFVKIDKDGNVYTLGFAIRCKYLREMYETMDFVKMERNWINVENEVGDYIKRKVKSGDFKVFYVDKLDIKANIYGSSAAPGCAAEILIY
jgi:hypothetical protein